MPSAPEQSGKALAPGDVDHLFAAIELTQFSHLAVGVSGGADSLSLLWCLNDWSRRTSWSGRLTALTVDHGLRPESAAEADDVGEICERMGVMHRVLRWTGDKPTANLQALAREARYRLIADEMKALGAEALLVAHHQDDQVETFLDRLTRGSGVYGLGGIRLDEMHGIADIRVLRPFLSVPKERLTATLGVAGLGWVEDPSNINPAFKRVRLRQLAIALEAEGFDRQRLLETSRRMARTGAAIDHFVERVWQRDLLRHPAGPVMLAADIFFDLPEEVRLRLLARLIRDLGDRDYPPRMEKLERLDEGLLSSVPENRSLGGAMFRVRDGKLLSWPELGREPPAPLRLAGASAVTWDRRFHWQGRADCKEIFIGPLAKAPKTEVNLTIPQPFPRQAFERAPALWTGETLLHVPGLWGEISPYGTLRRTATY